MLGAGQKPSAYKDRDSPRDLDVSQMGESPVISLNKKQHSC
jgi:hypothetical protein